MKTKRVTKANRKGRAKRVQTIVWYDENDNRMKCKQITHGDAF